MQISGDMSFPLWGLAIFILWIIFVVCLLSAVRIRHLSAGGSIKDFAIADEENLPWRLYRVQANLAENLPLYIGVLLLLIFRGVSGTMVDLLIVVYLVFRLLHSVIHIAGMNPNLRFFCLIIQLSCLVTLTAKAILPIS